jgi:acetylornithine aminotransferase/acetylornithine/N-succinyldiaminopimelate aminotransferase
MEKEERTLLLHDESPEAVVAREAKYLVSTYKRTAFHPREGNGAQLIDADGKVYTDLLSGIAVHALGYSHPALQRVLEEEATGLLHVSNLFHHPAQGLLAEKLVEISGLSRVFFCNSGTEANEAAIKFVRLANPSRTQIVALEESFHGRTIGALSLTGHEAYRTPFAPLLPSVRFVPANDIEALKAAVSDKTAAIFLEPIMGEGGVVPLSVEFMQEASRLAHTTGALLVCDEIQCGLGRTGEWFGYQDSGVVPDIVTVAKPLGGGLPLGATIVGPALNGLVKPGHHGTTFGGNPLACRLGLAVIETIEHERTLKYVNETGQWLGEQLAALKCQVPSIVDVRGRGLMWGIELDAPAAPINAKLLEKGFVVGTAREKVLRLLPPYVITREALSGFLTELYRLLQPSAALEQATSHAA